MRRLVLSLITAFLLLSTGQVRGQSSTGSIVGTVIDSQGLPIAEAAVTLTNVGTNFSYTSTTGSNGGYQFRSIDYGYYRVSVTKSGFKAGVVNNVKLDTATQYSVPPIILEVGATAESVTVEAGAELVQTASAEVTGTVDKKQIDELPILDRNPLGLLGLQAGVNQNSNINTVINGQRTSFSNMTLDGINIQDNFIRENALDFTPNSPFLSQAQEFTITSQNGDVEKGGSSGVSIVTPKGANNWHGEGFWYYRSNAVGRANDWFNDARGIPVPGLLQNQGGGNIGGPIKKDKLFIYGYYELLRLRAQTPNNTVILSPAIQAALTAPTPTLPFTFQPVDSNGNPSGPLRTVDLLTVEQSNPNRMPTVPPNPPPPLPPPTTFAVNSTMLSLIQRLPRTSNNNNAGDGINLLGFSFNERNNTSRDNYGFRADYNLNAKNSFSGTWSYNRSFFDRPDIDTSFNRVPIVSNDDHIKFLSTAWRWNPNANVTNEVRFGFDFAPAFFLTSQKFGSSVIDSGGFPFTGPDPNFQPQGRNVHTYSYQDNASWVHGNHFIKFGGQLQRVTIFETNSAGDLPDLGFGFSAVNTSAYDPSDFATSNTQIGTTDFNNASALVTTAAGILSNVSQTFNVTSQTSKYVPLAPSAHNLRQNNLAFYLADNWRITRKLTFNYGFRWDYFSPVDERDGLTLLPVVPPGQTAAQTLLSDATVDFAGGPSKRGLYHSYYKGFSPNIGLAWDPFGDGKMAIRAGFSLNYVNDAFFTAAENAFSANPGLSTTNTAAPNGLNGPTVSNAPTVPTPPFGIPTTFSTNAMNLGVPNNVGYAIDPRIKPPYVEQWNLTVQRQIGANTSVSLGYLGNHGVGLFRAIDVNQVVIGSNGFLADFNRARSNGFLSLAANGTFDPLFNGPGSQPLTIFPNICGPGAFGFLDQLAFINNDVQNGFIGDLAHIYQEFGCGPSPGFFAPNDFILGGDLLKNASFSTYHSGKAEVLHRLSNGLYLQANYVFSKVLTDYGPSDPLGGDQVRFLPYLDNARPRLERGRAPFDISHAFKANFTYDLPVGKGHSLSSSNRFVSQLLDGWQTGSIFTWQSGNPFSILSTQPTFNRSGPRSSRNTAIATLSPGQIAGDTGVFVQTNGTVYGINPKLVSPNGTGAPPSNGLSCVPAVSGGFCNPQPGQVGNLSIDAFTAPTFFDWDLAAAKDFRITERFKLTFRTEAFNVLNHPVFFVGDQNINSRHFGQVVETAAIPTGTISAARRIQLSLRLKF